MLGLRSPVGFAVEFGDNLAHFVALVCGQVVTKLGAHLAKADWRVVFSRDTCCMAANVF